MTRNIHTTLTFVETKKILLYMTRHVRSRHATYTSQETCTFKGHNIYPPLAGRKSKTWFKKGQASEHTLDRCFVSYLRMRRWFGFVTGTGLTGLPSLQANYWTCVWVCPFYLAFHKPSLGLPSNQGGGEYIMAANCTIWDTLHYSHISLHQGNNIYKKQYWVWYVQTAGSIIS